MPSQPPATKTTLFRGDHELDLAAAADALAAGHLIAFPTETVYGLGADATNAAAVASIFTAKRRPADNPLIVHLSSAADLARWPLTPLPLAPLAARLAAAFWPGPLTLVLPLAPRAPLARAVTAGLVCVGLRVPRHPVAAALLARANVPVAAPSANLSGRPSPTCAAHVLRDLDGAVFGVVEGAAAGAECGLESTVVDLTDAGAPAVLRPGAVSCAELERVGGVRFRRAGKGGRGEEEGPTRPKAPGMKYRHYAPRAPVEVVGEGEIEGRVRVGGLVGVLAEEKVCERWRGVEGVRVARCGVGDAESFARELYGALRAFDGEGDGGVREAVEMILAVPPAAGEVEDGIGEAVMNRLYKAAAAAAGQG